MQKTFILDTNVLLHDPAAILSFEGHKVVIPIYVVEEIDNFKKELSELGRNARQVSRYLDEQRIKGSLSKGVKTENNTILSVVITSIVLPPHITVDRGQDAKILAVALDLTQKASVKEDVVFITKDTNLRIRADAIGIKTENYDPSPADISDLYKGYREMNVMGNDIDRFYSENKLCLEKSNKFFPNEYVSVTNSENTSHSALGFIDYESNTLKPIKSIKQSAWGIRPRNKEQVFALDLLLNDSIKLVTLAGKAGTGKTLIALAAALQKVAEERSFQRVLISRPIFPLGKDIGFLPGDIDEKLSPWMQPIFDNLEFLMRKSQGSYDQSNSYQELIDLGFIKVEPLTYIRGRSIPSQFMIVDEAQNLTPHEVKTIISRMGEGAKIVLTGDPNQIDNPYVDATNNGLTHVINCFMSEPIAGHINLYKGERSELAALAANIL